MQKGLINLQNTTGGLTADETEMIHPLTPIAIQLNQMNIPIPTNHPTIMEDPASHYAINQSLQNQIPTSTLFREFLGSTQSNIEETVIEDPYAIQPKKRKWIPWKIYDNICLVIYLIKLYEMIKNIKKFIWDWNKRTLIKILNCVFMG